MSQSFYKCHVPDDVHDDALVVPAVPHPEKLWQAKFDGYKAGGVVSKRPFNAIFSTTTADIHVPPLVYNSISKVLAPTKDKFGVLTYDCNRQKLLKNITLSLGDKELVIPHNVYGEYFLKVCRLRLRKSAGDFWVLGLQWFQSYATCFNPDKQTIQFNTINRKILNPPRLAYNQQVAVEEHSFTQHVRCDSNGKLF